MRKSSVSLILLSVLLAACGRHEQTVANPPATSSAKGASAVTQTTSSAAVPEEPTASEVKVGAKMPAYSAKSVDGAEFDLASLRGKVVFVNLWATWCGPCRAEIPALQQFQKDYAAKGFEIVGVSLDENGPEAVRAFMNEQKMTYPVVIDENAKALNLFRASVIPISALIDRQGNVAWMSAGSIEQSVPAVRQEIEKALAAK